MAFPSTSNCLLDLLLIMNLKVCWRTALSGELNLLFRIKSTEFHYNEGRKHDQDESLS